MPCDARTLWTCRNIRINTEPLAYINYTRYTKEARELLDVVIVVVVVCVSSRHCRLQRTKLMHTMHIAHEQTHALPVVWLNCKTGANILQSDIHANLWSGFHNIYFVSLMRIVNCGFVDRKSENVAFATDSRCALKCVVHS